MNIESIDHQTLSRLAEAREVRATHVVSRPGGWGVMVQFGGAERLLAATRSREVRVFKKLETLVGYLKGIGITRFEVDAAGFDPQTVSTYRRPDASAALKHAHAAAAHDAWFRGQVTQALAEAEDPATPWVSNDAVKSESAKRRSAWRERSAKGGPGQHAA